MKAYSKVIYRDFKKLFTKLLAIIFIVALGVAFLVGLLTTAPNMRHTIDTYYKDMKTADVVVQKQTPFTADEITDLKNHADVSDAMPYFMIDEQIEFMDTYHMSRIVLLDFKEGININQLKLIDGRYPVTTNDRIEVIVEATQSYLLDIPLGFTTEIMGQTFEVVGIVNHPWYFAYVQEISVLSGRPIESMIYVDQSFLEEQTYTHVALTLKDANSLNTFSSAYKNLIEDKVDVLSTQYSNYFFTTRLQNQSFVKFNSDVEIVEVIALIFPVFFFLITILVSMSSMTRIIHDERIQIGTLRSLGFSNYKIIIKYILYVLIASSIGVLLGIAIGIYSIPAIAYNAYVITYNLPPLAIDYHFTYISAISLTMIGSVLIVTFFSIKNILKEKPSELLKHKAPKAGKKIFLERIPLIWNRLKFKYKSSIRNIFRQKRNLFLMLIGISGSTALLLAGFGIKDAVEISGSTQFDQMYQFDMELSIQPNQTNQELLNAYHTLNFMIETVHFEESDYIYIIVPEVDDKLNDFLHFKDKNEHDITFNEQSVFVTEQFARKHGLLKGDIISLDFQGVQKSFEVTEVIEFYFGNYIYVSHDLIKDDYVLVYNRTYVQTPNLSQTALHQLIDALNVEDDIIQVQTKEDLMAAFRQTSSSMNSVILLLIAFASILAIIINYNLTLINISTRYKEMATLKVLGYQEIEVSGYIFRETFMISTVAIFLGLGIGRLLQYFIISQVNVDGIILKNAIYPLSLLYTVLLSYVFLIVVYLVSLPKIKKIDMLQALKSFE